MAVKPIKMLVLNLNSHLLAWIFIKLFTTPQFVAKMNINDVLCKNPSLSSCVQYPRRRAKSFGCLKKSSLQKFWVSRLSKAWPKTRWCPRNNFQQVHNRQTKVTVLKLNYSAKSMQTLQHVRSVAFFKLLTKTFITFEPKIIFL